MNDTLKATRSTRFIGLLLGTITAFVPLSLPSINFVLLPAFAIAVYLPWLYWLFEINKLLNFNSTTSAVLAKSVNWLLLVACVASQGYISVGLTVLYRTCGCPMFDSLQQEFLVLSAPLVISTFFSAAISLSTRSLRASRRDVSRTGLMIFIAVNLPMVALFLGRSYELSTALWYASYGIVTFAAFYWLSSLKSTPQI